MAGFARLASHPANHIPNPVCAELVEAPSFFSRRQKPEGAVTGLFCLGYGIIRFCVEFVREPDSFLGLRALGLSQGQWLSLPLILLGIFLIVRAYRVRR